MPRPQPHPFDLPSLHTKPSWHNRAGRVDRSACLALPASALWRHADFQPARNFQGRTARARYLLTAHELNDHIAHARPRQLVGDQRTSKSNAMRHPHRGSLPSPHARIPNPNRGPARTKRLCLPFDWTQELTIERWAFPMDEKKTPRSLSRLRTAKERLDKIAKDSSKDREELRLMLSIPRPRTQHFLICPACNEKFVKLFLPQCTQREVDDSALAQAYLRDRALRFPNAPGDPQEAHLVARYSILFHPRQLKCRHCLGLRYGEARSAT